jgi:AAA domain
VRLLDDAATLRAAQDDPAGFVEHDGLMVIDEIQLAPELLRAIKVLVDLDPRPGRFLLTGSSRILALRTLPDALPGRRAGAMRTRCRGKPPSSLQGILFPLDPCDPRSAPRLPATCTASAGVPCRRGREAWSETSRVAG